MKYLKITDLFPNGSINADYKGLDISRFKVGSQVYPVENGIQFAYVATDAVADINFPDVEEITEQEYLQAVEDYQTSQPKPMEEQVNDLQSTVDQLVIDALMGGA